MVRTTCRPTTCVTAHIVYTAVVGTALLLPLRKWYGLCCHGRNPNSLCLLIGVPMAGDSYCAVTNGWLVRVHARCLFDCLFLGMHGRLCEWSESWRASPPRETSPSHHTSLHISLDHRWQHGSPIHTSEVEPKLIFMGHPILSCHVPVISSFIILFETLVSS